MDNQFKEKIQKLFPSLELTYLDEITSKIALVPQIRVGKPLEFRDYEEVSLLNSKSENGVLISSESKKPSLPANAQLVHKHSLKRGDLLLSYRARNHIKVLRVKDTPQRAMVGNTATVRIEFENHDKKSMPLLVQSYLQLDIVQEYLIHKAIEHKKSKNTSRFLISPQFLRDLPTPRFIIDNDAEFEEVMIKRTHLSALSQEISDQIKELYHQSDKLLQCSLPSYINNPKKLKESSLRDKDVITKLIKLQQSLRDVSLELEGCFINEVV